MHPYDWWTPGFPWMWIFPFMFFLAIVFMVVFFTLFLRGGPFWWRHGHHDPTRETPRQILDRRYASGEINKEQYEEMKRDLER